MRRQEFAEKAAFLPALPDGPRVLVGDLLKVPVGAQGRPRVVAEPRHVLYAKPVRLELVVPAELEKNEPGTRGPQGQRRVGVLGAGHGNRRTGEKELAEHAVRHLPRRMAR